LKVTWLMVPAFYRYQVTGIRFQAWSR